VFLDHRSFLQIYTDEDTRASKFRETLAENDIVMTATRIDGTKYSTDGDMHWKNFRYLILEAKLEIGAKGAEPLFQAGWYYQEFTKKPTIKSLGSPLPCLLISLCGGFNKAFPLAHMLNLSSRSISCVRRCSLHGSPESSTTC